MRPSRFPNPCWAQYWNGFSAHVPELPSILVTGDSVEQLRTRAVEAIQLYWDVLRAERSPTSTVAEIDVELPAYPPLPWLPALSPASRSPAPTSLPPQLLRRCRYSRPLDFLTSVEIQSLVQLLFVLKSADDARATSSLGKANSRTPGSVPGVLSDKRRWMPVGILEAAR